MGDEQMTAEARQLWRRVEELWGLSVARDEAGVRAALHPDYTGWVTGQPLPHDRDAAIRSVGPDAPRVLDYRLSPLAVRVFDGTAGVAHYSYAAEVETATGSSQQVAGRWSEVYLRGTDGLWLMVSVSGGPDGQR